MNSPFSPPTFTKTTTAADMFVQTVYFHVGQKLKEVRALQVHKARQFPWQLLISFLIQHIIIICPEIMSAKPHSSPLTLCLFCMYRGSIKKPTLWQHIPSPHEYFTPLYHTYQGDFKVGCVSKALVHKQKSLCACEWDNIRGLLYMRMWHFSNESVCRGFKGTGGLT